MKRIVLLVVALFLVIGMPFAGVASNVSVNVNIGPPPPLEFVAPPDVVVVPSGGTDVYLVPGTAGLYFYGGYWYRFHGGYWFRAGAYSAPWVPIQVSLVPSHVVVIPPDYILNMPPGYHRIHYNDFHSHWNDWGRTKHWHNQNWYKDHSRTHWAGQEFHRPPGHPGGGKGPHDRGPNKGTPGVAGSHDRGPRGKPTDVGPQAKGPRGDAKPRDKGPGGPAGMAGPQDKGPRGPSSGAVGRTHDNGPKGKSGVASPQDRGPKGKPVDVGFQDKGPR
jgi:hypothetical protein